jgi:hypothetical protein
MGKRKCVTHYRAANLRLRLASRYTLIHSVLKLSLSSLLQMYFF